MSHDCAHGVSPVLAQRLRGLLKARFLWWLLLTQDVDCYIVLQREKHGVSPGCMDSDFNTTFHILWVRYARH